MSLMNLIDKLYKKDSIFAEPALEKRNDVFMNIREDCIQENAVTELYDPFSDPTRLALNVPDVLPCESDVTMQFWIKRLQFWGNPKIVYINPDGKKNNVSIEDFEKAMTEPEDIVRIFGQWVLNKKSVKSFDATREFMDASGKKRKETYRVDIDLHKELVPYFKGNF